MNETYGQQVRRLRKERGWTQDQLSDISGVPKRTIQDVEGDKHATVQRDTRLKLSRTLEIEGSPEGERNDWTEDVRRITDIVGAYLMTLSPSEQIAWFSDVMQQALDRGGRHE